MTTHSTPNPNRKKRRLAVFLLITLILGIILYLLADRYLIEHVEVVVQNENTTSSSQTTDLTQGASVASNATYDDSSYSSDDVQINITKNEQGSGDDKITYYVADVVLKSADNLLSAFADDSFGRNITQNTSDIASAHQAIFAINGDYYGFRNDGVIIRNGTLYRNSPARTGLAFYNNGNMASYDENTISSSLLLADGVTQTLSFGPVLVKDSVAISDFSNVMIDTNFGNRSIQDTNPRTGVGIISSNHYVFVVVDGRNQGYSRGMTLDEFAQLFEGLGVTEAYNLDGGGSSTMYFMGKVINNPQGKNRERGVSDILYIKER